MTEDQFKDKWTQRLRALTQGLFEAGDIARETECDVIVGAIGTFRFPGEEKEYAYQLRVAENVQAFRDEDEDGWASGT